MMREVAIYRFVCAYKASNDGNSPSVREIAQACRINSTSLVAVYLRRLEEAGLIVFSGVRSIRVVNGEWRLKEAGDE